MMTGFEDADPEHLVAAANNLTRLLVTATEEGATVEHVEAARIFGPVLANVEHALACIRRHQEKGIA